ncbi:MAG TPA: EAL domain-containing protein [Terracidiphilus sp.]|nr:EAL domain-containing protein [Terracidiphilus sp.]
MGRNPDKTVLLIENDPEQTRIIRAMLDDHGSRSFKLAHVKCLADAEIYLKGHPVDIVLWDLSLSDPEGQVAIKRVRAAVPHVSIVLLSSLDDEPKAMQAMREGAEDYLIKGQIEPHTLMQALGNAVVRTTNEEILTNEKDRAEATLESIADAVICTDISGNITFFNPVASSMVGWPLKAAVGRHLTETFRIVDATTRQPILDPMAKAASENLTGTLPPNCVLIDRDGREVFIEDSVAPIHDREGTVTGAVIVFRDVSAARARSKQMAHLAEHDSLTGLPNRSLFCDRVGQAISLARRHRGQAAVLFLDLDGFKQINDSLGHAAGDKLLQSVAKRLLACVRDPDTVSRYGGDEFAVLLQDIHRHHDVAATARRVLGALGEVHSVDGHQVHVTASIGMSVCPGDGFDAETLIRNADTAMYRAKKNGCQSCEFYSPELNVCTFERQFTGKDLERALERNELTLHYQPKVNLKTGAITGAEALSRWNHPTHGTISPGQFIPIAEETGLILPIGAWVFDEACSQARTWADAGMPAKSMAVNVSGVQFQSEDFLDGLFAALDKNGLDPSILELDVNESVLMRHPERTAFVLKALRDKGVHVSVDQFGTGNSSLSSMQKLPVNALKIDRSFLRQITTVPGGSAAVEAFIDMARGLHLRVIALGVETVEDLEFLWAHDCDEAQGNFFGPPVPPGQLTKLFRPN